jgi:hypothetical protein
MNDLPNAGDPIGATSNTEEEEGFKDCDAVCGYQIDGTAGNTCKKTCTKVTPHGGSHNCSTHGAF